MNVTGSHRINEPVCAAQRQPIADEVAEFAQMLANRAAALSDRLDSKLHRVMLSDDPRPCGADCVETAYPPLFADLRNSFRGIAASLDRIDHALDRTEL